MQDPTRPIIQILFILIAKQFLIWIMSMSGNAKQKSEKLMMEGTFSMPGPMP
jgi:hypothetical protein